MFSNNPFRILRFIVRANRPSRLKDMVAVRDAFWLRKGYEALTFFGTILTHSQEEADAINASPSPAGSMANLQIVALKNHEMIHLRQAQSTHDSWFRFYTLYIKYWLQARRYRHRLKNAGYRLNPFEMEAYAYMHDPTYLERCRDGATGWKRFAGMTLEERLNYINRKHGQ